MGCGYIPGFLSASALRGTIRSSLLLNLIYPECYHYRRVLPDPMCLDFYLDFCVLVRVVLDAIQEASLGLVERGGIYQYPTDSNCVTCSYGHVGMT